MAAVCRVTGIFDEDDKLVFSGFDPGSDRIAMGCAQAVKAACLHPIDIKLCHPGSFQIQFPVIIFAVVR